ncbi:hypothetical protein LTR10_020449 [Elasticomyces elasticus]|uniref:Stress-response A/B barrel domain-containing protein n=1 Tax=Exophiala sideris TaxID=1016849 RepID=A0ABR0J3Q0_9EURO|nr:hypothetical protein LTR10_020449 [Elasticomyces elasticus]KAK5027027.1 hypothetical protein LTS07_007326 [Exophiala sideris]KAK5034031.1 hypothetical protein LTR13_006631 [Exophiala sideris]KAK5055694.1 hypothetical protein LTR69_008069 [Exophiala sideris]KAK5180973.1 hypothetical protein LTR44_006793 [Eurotiomycetes sp. CCFEE 6388]
MAAKPVYRLTLFKIPDEGNQDKLLELYRTMPQDALKDGKPYIVSAKAGKTVDDSRNQGYTIAVVTHFASMEDFKYYDTQCAAHTKLKSFAKTVHQGNMMTFFEPAGGI